MLRDQKKYGYVSEPIKIGEDWVFGSVLSAGGKVLQPSGQWDNFLPEIENQKKNNVETIACVSFGTLSACEILLRRLYNE